MMRAGEATRDPAPSWVAEREEMLRLAAWLERMAESRARPAAYRARAARLRRMAAELEGGR